MEQLGLPVQLLIALGLGAAIGLEREAHELEQKTKQGFLGVRTFSLLTLLGAVSGAVLKTDPTLAYLIATTSMLLLISYYILNAIFTKDIGLTTEIAVIFSYCAGFFLTAHFLPIQVIVALVIVVILILSRKKYITEFVGALNRTELNAFISYAILALVILPFLPNASFQIADIPNIKTLVNTFGVSLGTFASIEIVNPFKLWVVVALITGVDLAGYALERTLGKNKGWLIASLVGGVISSTATTQSLAQESKTSRQVNQLVGAAVLSNMMSFVPLFLLILTLNGAFLANTTVFFAAAFAAAGLAGVYFLKKDGKQKSKKEKHASSAKQAEIFALTPALKFAAFFLVIKFVSKVSLAVFGESGLFITSAIAATTGMDAITITITELVGDTISSNIGLYALAFANSVNLLSKCFYSYLQGSREFAVKLTNSMMFIIGVSLLSILFI